MDFKVGDQVIHKAYGPGEITKLDEKVVSGQVNTYYIVQMKTMTLYVPVSDPGSNCLRPPTPTSSFEELFEILRGPGEPLPEDRMERKNLLTERLRAGRLEAVCQVIRDLTYLNRKKKLNDYDAAIFERARSFLLNEWRVAFSIPIQQAEHELQKLLAM